MFASNSDDGCLDNFYCTDDFTAASHSSVALGLANSLAALSIN